MNSNNNPLKSDPQLRALLKRLDTIHKYKTFHRWKAKFLDRLLPQLVYEKGMTPAKERCDLFSVVLERAAKQAHRVAHHLEQGKLNSADKVTVKARLALQELANQLTVTVEHLADWIPTSVQEEKKMKYTKFHLGASLIEQGFHQYITMKQMEDAIQALEAQIGEDILDRQQVELFSAYHTQVERFCDVMADLNLYEIMKKCLEFATPPDEEESSDEEAIVIDISNGDKIIQIEVQPSDKLKGVKETIADAFDIPYQQQVIKLKGKQLTNKDSDTLSGCGIQDKSKLLVELQMIDITVETLDGAKRIPMRIDPMSETVGAVQDVIADKLAIPLDNQILKFKNFVLQKPTATVAQEKIPHGAKLVVQPRKVPVTVHTFNGKKICLVVDPADTTLKGVKVLVEPESGVSPDNQRIFRNDERDDELMDSKTKLADYGVKANGELYMEPKSITIHVEMPKNYKSFDTEIDLSHTMQESQSKINQKTGMPISEQIVTYKNKKISPTDTAKLLGLQDGDTIKVKSNRVKIHVEMPDKSQSFDMEVSPEMTTEEMKRKITKETKMPVQEQIVGYKNNTLPPTATAKSLSLQDGDTLHVKSNKVKVHIDMPEKYKSFDMEVPPDQTGQEMQKRISEKTGMPIQEQIVTYKKKLVLPASTVESLGLQNGDVLELKSNRVKIHVEMPDKSKCFDMEAPPEMTTQQIQKKIAEKTGMSAQEQLVSYKNLELLPTATVESLGLQDGDTLNVKSNKVKVHVDMPGAYQSFDMEVPPDQTGQEMQKRISEKTGMPVQEQIVTYKNKEIPLTSTPKSLAMQDGDTLKVNYIKMPVTVKSKKDNSLIKEIMVDPEDKLLALKQQIAKAAGVKPEQQELSLENGQILNGLINNAVELGITPGCVLYLDGQIVVSSKGEVNMSLDVKVNEEPSKDDYDDLVEATKEFYASRLKKSYPESFQSVDIAVHKALWRADKPSPDYNIYVEWDLSANFAMSGEVPTRHALCGNLATANLTSFLRRLMNLNKAPFDQTRGAYTKQTN